ncbi:MAG: phosphoglucosamine mutase [Planctomycetota bacterium]
MAENATGEAPLMLSVSGMRGIVGASLTPIEAVRFAGAFATWLGAGDAGAALKVVVGRDSRPSGQALSSAVLATLGAMGVEAVDIGVCATPTVGVMVEQLGASGGLMVTASHNPAPWNGLKPIRGDGASLPPHEAQAVIDAFRAGVPAWVDATAVGRVTTHNDAAATHVERVLEGIDVKAVRAAKLRVVVDSVHGGGGAAAAMLFDRLGVAAEMMYAEPTGDFPHTPEPTEANLVELCERVKASGADLGFAQDPDADRLAIVGPGGVYLGEECTLVAAAARLLKAGDVAVANLSTSRMIDDAAAVVGATVARSAVGEANVAALMRERGAIIGGEGNGGVIWPRVGQIRDSIGGMALALEWVAREGRSIDALLEPYRRYTIVKHKLPADPSLHDKLEPALREAFANGAISTVDGVRVDEGKAWVHVRASNTEPIFRVIAEAESAEAANAMVERARRALGIEL